MIPSNNCFVMHNGVNLVDLINEPAWKTILYSLASSTKMDVWNIDISALADAYLERINLLGTASLSIPANAILASAILLRFKARIVQISSIREDGDEDSLQMAGDLDAAEKQVFEEFLPELRNVRRLREGGRISLDSLVEAIEVILEKSKKKRSAVFERENIEFRVPFSDFNLEEKMVEIYERITCNLDSQGMVVFSSLVKSCEPDNVVRSFISCLFLFNKGRINMWQTEFWDDIFISLGEDNPVSG